VQELYTYEMSWMIGLVAIMYFNG